MLEESGKGATYTQGEKPLKIQNHELKMKGPSLEPLRLQGIPAQIRPLQGGDVNLLPWVRGNERADESMRPFLPASLRVYGQ